MTNYKEIVTKAVLSKGKRLFTTTNQVRVDNPSTILGCWVINHQFQGVKSNHEIVVTGSYDVNIWYSYDNDTKTNVVKETNSYRETIHMRDHEESTDEEVIVRSLRQPNCVKAELEGDTIVYTIEKELGIELVGDVKVKIETSSEEDPWDEIGDGEVFDENVSEKIDENFLKEEALV